MKDIWDSHQIGQSKKSAFAFIKDMVVKRKKGWAYKFLSRVGKEVLLKLVVQELPKFCIGVFQLLISLCEELERMMNSFFVGVEAR